MATDSLTPPKAVRDLYGSLDGTPVEAVTIRNANGLRARLISYGARLTEFWAPDRNGRMSDLVLGWDTLDEYVAERGCFGATCGRYANRIADGRFVLDGDPVQLVPNEGPNQLHGGPDGFDKRIWEIVANDDHAVVFALTSVDGDQGYPGRLRAEVAFCLRDDDTLEIAFSATTDAPTIANLVNHAYWNLAGHDAGDVFDQFLQVDAERFVPVSLDNIPTGETARVAGTPFNFRTAKPIGHDIANTPLGYYDHTFCLSGARGTFRESIVLRDPGSGRRMVLSTTEAGVQVYTAGHLDGLSSGKCGARYPRGAGIALETQTWPDAPNRRDFPSARLDPDQIYSHRTELRFTADA